MISMAYAQDAAVATKAGGLAGGMEPFLMMVVVFAIFFFIVIRPQQKQQKKLKQMIADAKRGDEVITASGMHGKIAELKEDNSVMLQVANNVVIKIEKSSIQFIKGYEQKK